MSTTRILIGIAIGGLLGPGLGITANMRHAPWLILPAVACVFAGNYLIYSEAKKRSAAKQPSETSDD